MLPSAAPADSLILGQPDLEPLLEWTWCSLSVYPYYSSSIISSSWLLRICLLISPFLK